MKKIKIRKKTSFKPADKRNKKEDIRKISHYNRELIEASVDPLVTIGADGKIQDVNKATENATGYKKKEMVGKDFAEYFTEPDKARAGYKIVFKNGKVKDYALSIKHKNGRATHVLYNAAVYRDEKGTIAGVFAAARDVTDIKKAEMEIARIGYYNRELIETSVDPLVTIGSDGKIQDVNKASENATGYKKKEMVGKDFSDYFTEPDRARLGYKKVFKAGKVIDYPLSIKHKDGRVMPVLYNASVYRDEKGNVAGVFAAARDITRLKAAEDELIKHRDKLEEMVKNRTAALEKSEKNLVLINEALKIEMEKTRHYLDVSEALIVELDRNGNVLNVNKKIKEILGYLPQELVGKNWFDFFIKPEFQNAVRQPFEKMMTGQGDNIEYFENQLKAKDGTMKMIYWHNTLVKDAAGSILKTISSGNDITGLRNAENELGRSEERFKLVFEKSTAGVSLTSPEGNVQKANEAFAKMLGYTVDELQTKNFSGVTFPEDLPETKKAVRALATGEKASYRLEKRYIHKDGSVVWADVSTAMMFDGAKQPMYLITTILDITERKKSQELVAESEEKYRTLFNSAEVGMYRSKLDGSGFMFGYTKAELMSGPALMRWANPEARKKMLEVLKEKGSLNEYEIEVITKTGEHRILLSSIRLFQEKGYLEGTAIDITERKVAEKNLEESESRFRAVFERSTVGKSLTSPEGKLLKINTAFAQMLGYSLDEMQSINFVDITHPDDVEESRGCIRRLISGEISIYRFEKRYIHKNGSIVWADMSTSLLRDEKNTPLYFITTIMDISVRKKMEMAVAESEEKFRSIFEQAQVGMVIASGDKKFMKVNDKFCKMLGYTAEELCKMGIADVTYKESLERDMKGIDEQLEGKRDIYATEKRYVRKGGSTVWASTNAAIVKKDGKFQYFVTIIEDISARKQAEELRQKSEVKLRRFYESGLVGVVYWNMDGKITDCNDRYLEMTGYTRKELETGTMDWSIMTPTEFAEADAAAVKELLETGVNKNVYEKAYFRKDGSTVPVVIACAMLDEAHYDGVAFVLDITDRKKAERIVMKEKEKLQRYLTVTEAIVVELDTSGRIVSLNDKGCGVFNFKPGDETGINWFDICIDEETRPQVKAVFAKLMSGEMQNTEFYENEIRTGVGSIRSFYWHNVIIKGKTNKIKGTLSSGIDVTEQRKVERELQKTLKNLERSNKELEQFAFVASHDLQEPLRAITGYIQLLDNKYTGKIDADADKYIKATVLGSNRMRDLINDLLAFSRIESSKKSLKKIDMNTIFDTVLFGMNRANAESGVEITKDNLPVVLADETHMVQLLQNLIGNGIKFHGTKKVKIHVGVKDEGKEYIFSVKDNGIGIEPQYFEKIFVIFQRLHGRDEYPGTGIGLSICKKIIERHNGRMWVESEPGKGSVFYFTMMKAG
jgi:PAS domain S-box-containing protein